MKKSLSKSTEWSGFSSKSEGRRFLLLAVVILPIVMFLGVCTYGFIVWFSQLLFFGPPV